MDKRVIRVVAAVAALAVFAPEVLADHDGPKKRRKGFFESLFGTSEERQARRERKRLEAEQRRQWWLEEQGLVPQKKKKSTKVAKNAAPIGDGDPEPLPGFGMGNVAFVLPRQVAVADAGLSALSTTDVGANAIKLTLTDKSTPIKADAAIKDAVINLYRQNNLKPIWLANGAPSDRAKAVLETLKNAGAEGLVAARYLPAGLKSFDNIEQQIEGSSLGAAQFDVGLSVAAATYAEHLTGGAFEPNKLSLYHDVKPESVDPNVALKVLSFTPFPQQYLVSLTPKHPAYALLKAELAKLADVESAKPAPFPAGKRVKPGQKDERILELRSRMSALGHLAPEDAAVVEGSGEILDKKLSQALKAYQQDAGIAQTGALDQATVKSFNTDTSGSEREKIISSLERIRWLPHDLGQKHVFVNQAAYEVDVMDKGQPIWTSRVIVGRPTTQTYVFHDEMETVVFNPTWGMPQSILVNEYLGKLRRDPGYFDRIGYHVVNAKGKKVSSRSINWGSVGANSGIGVIQPAGDGNALGDVKFLFPNAHSIYMHDTPNRNLFAEERRSFSHGCVRVQNPREFAQVLLGMSAEEVDERIAEGATQNVKVSTKIPVHLTYFTAWPDNSGKIRYYSDIYERDKTLEGARRIVAKAYGDDSAVKIVEASASGQAIITD
jgi:murein L,D-transpeptidase YcbB/YkuD